MSKWTPGPWTANKPTRDNGRAEVHAGCMLVAQAFNWMLDAEGDEQCWADARLIAAAPMMYEALVMVRDADEDCRRDGLPTIPPAARAFIDAAIAKAEEA